MRTTEPLPGYDALGPEQIATALAGADAETVKAVRESERKFGHRSKCWTRPRACFRPRGRAPGKIAPGKRKTRASVTDSRVVSKPLAALRLVGRPRPLEGD